MSDAPICCALGWTRKPPALLDLAVAADRAGTLACDAYTFLSEANDCFTRHGRRGAIRLAVEQLKQARGDIDSLIVELEGRLS